MGIGMVLLQIKSGSAALAHWVEDGVAPTQIVATKYQDNDPRKGISMQRPWGPYPKLARCSGCAAPDAR